MARKTALNPDGTGFQFGKSVRVERGYATQPVTKLEPPEKAEGGHVHPEAEPVWIVSRRVDVSDDKATTYDYRFEPVGSFTEDELGELPKAAEALADKLASEGE